MSSALSIFNTTTEVSLSKAPNPQLLPGRCSINDCPLLRVCVHGVCVFTAVCVCVCSLLCVCVCVCVCVFTAPGVCVCVRVVFIAVYVCVFTAPGVCVCDHCSGCVFAAL